MDTNAIRALTFDVFGTVVDWRSSIIREGEAAKDVTPAHDWDVVARDFEDLADRLGC